MADTAMEYGCEITLGIRICRTFARVKKRREILAHARGKSKHN